MPPSPIISDIKPPHLLIGVLYHVFDRMLAYTNYLLKASSEYLAIVFRIPLRYNSFSMTI